MKFKHLILIVALMFFGAVSSFAKKADHSSKEAVAESFVNALFGGDFECFSDSLTAKSRAEMEAEGNAKAQFMLLSAGIKQQIPADQIEIFKALMTVQVTNGAEKVNDGWYINADKAFKD